MRITFHGAARTVTGSKHSITLDNGTGILLDCGMFQGLGQRTAQLNDDFGFKAADVSIVLLSHAHIDHSGLLPKLVAEGFNGKIYCTQATKELSEILLHDSAEIQLHSNNDKQNEQYFTVEDVLQTMEQFELIEYDQWFEPVEGVSVLYTQTGHLIGGAAIHLKVLENGKETAISYSADVGRARHPLLQPATAFPQAEYIILESTYGDKHHDLLANKNLDTILEWINKTCIEKKGQLIIPAFSVGRTQEILFLLNQLELEKTLPELKYFVDSPLSLKATEMIKTYVGEFNERLQKVLEVDDDPFSFKGLRYVESVEDSIKLTEYEEPCVIISASGTADAGRVRHHIRKAIGSEKNTILFSGYCGPESLGGQLLSGAKHVTIAGNAYEVQAEISQLKGLSAHGDCDDLCNFVACQDPGYVRGVFLVHGEHRVQESLAARLSARSFYPVHIPALHESFELNVHVNVTGLVRS
ncbi:MAG: MBL fold metallo-hydrolase [Chitinophagaceae bacterium]|nr:MBL fold metallo-hydrolase [Chitinophagaceae bacterium]